MAKLTRYILSGAIGAAVALLFTPKPGRELRRLLLGGGRKALPPAEPAAPAVTTPAQFATPPEQVATQPAQIATPPAPMSGPLPEVQPVWRPETQPVAPPEREQVPEAAVPAEAGTAPPPPVDLQARIAETRRRMEEQLAQAEAAQAAPEAETPGATETGLPAGEMPLEIPAEQRWEEERPLDDAAMRTDAALQEEEIAAEPEAEPAAATAPEAAAPPAQEPVQEPPAVAEPESEAEFYSEEAEQYLAGEALAGGLHEAGAQELEQPLVEEGVTGADEQPAAPQTGEERAAAAEPPFAGEEPQPEASLSEQKITQPEQAPGEDEFAALRTPAEGEPTFEEPTLEEPAQEEPAYEEPTYEEPSYEEPAALEEPGPAAAGTGVPEHIEQPAPQAAAPEPEREAGRPERAMIDQEEMRRRIDATRARLKAKAFDAMVSGETFIEGEGGQGRAREEEKAPHLDEETEKKIDESLREER